MTKGDGAGDLGDLSERAYEIAMRRQAAAAAVVELLEQHYESSFDSHAGTLLRAAAWLAGTSLFHSFGLPSTARPGSPVLSEQTNEQGPRLLGMFMTLITKGGVQISPGEPLPAIPAQDSPRLSILEVQQKFQRPFNDIMKQHGFDYAGGARSGAVACARLVRLHCQDRSDLDAKVAAAIVAMGFVEGSKTAPAA